MAAADQCFFRVTKAPASPRQNGGPGWPLAEGEPNPPSLARRRGNHGINQLLDLFFVLGTACHEQIPSLGSRARVLQLAPFNATQQFPSSKGKECGNCNIHVQLQHGLLTNDSLMQQNMIQNTAQGIFCIFVMNCALDGFANRDPQTASRIW